MDVMDAALHPGLRGLDEGVALADRDPAGRVWTGDPSSAPFAGEMDEHALDDAGEALDRAIFGAMLYSL